MLVADTTAPQEDVAEQEGCTAGRGAARPLNSATPTAARRKSGYQEAHNELGCGTPIGGHGDRCPKAWAKGAVSTASKSKRLRMHSIVRNN